MDPTEISQTWLKDFFLCSVFFFYLVNESVITVLYQNLFLTEESILIEKSETFVNETYIVRTSHGYVFRTLTRS